MKIVQSTKCIVKVPWTSFSNENPNRAQKSYFYSFLLAFCSHFNIFYSVFALWLWPFSQLIWTDEPYKTTHERKPTKIKWIVIEIRLTKNFTTFPFVNALNRTDMWKKRMEKTAQKVGEAINVWLEVGGGGNVGRAAGKDWISFYLNIFYCTSLPPLNLQMLFICFYSFVHTASMQTFSPAHKMFANYFLFECME